MPNNFFCQKNGGGPPGILFYKKNDGLAVDRQEYCYTKDFYELAADRQEFCFIKDYYYF